MTYAEMAERVNVPYCPGDCGITDRSHDEGFIFLNVVHFRERRFTRRGAKNFLTLVARRRRLLDPEFLNIVRFDWMYLYNDAVMAQKMARDLGFRIPAHLFDQEREQCRLLARRRKIHLSTYPAIWSWANSR